MKMFVVSVDDKTTCTAILLYLHPFVYEGNIQLFPAALSVDLECLYMPMAMQSKCPRQSVWIFGLKTTAMAQVHCSRGNNLIKVNGRWLEMIKPSKLLEPVLLLGRILFLCPLSAQLFPKICLLSPCFLCLPPPPPHCLPSTCWCSHLSKAALVKIPTIFTSPMATFLRLFFTSQSPFYFLKDFLLASMTHHFPGFLPTLLLFLSHLYLI